MAYESWTEPDVEDTSVPWAYGDTWHWSSSPAGGHSWSIEPLLTLHNGWWMR